ncbi:hypothetical protein EGW08_003094, partial [Elysia chlorotica]
ILLALDLFAESESGTPKDITESSRSSWHGPAASDEADGSVRSLDRETMRRLASLEQKFQSCLAMLGDGTQRGIIPETSAMPQWLPMSGGPFHPCPSGPDVPDLLCAADPVTELNRFLYGLERQSHDGYRDPRIILSNERKKFPHESLASAEQTRADVIPRQVLTSPVKAALPEEATRTQVVGVGGRPSDGVRCHGDRVFNTPRGVLKSPRGVFTSPHHVLNSSGDVVKSPNGLLNSPDDLLNGHDGLLTSPTLFLNSSPELLNSPGGLTASMPMKPRNGRLRHFDTEFGVVAAAAEKLSRELDLSETKPLFSLRRGERIRTPPPPPPPTCEGGRSPERATAEKQPGRIDHTGSDRIVQSPNSVKAMHDHEGSGLCPRRWQTDAPHCDGAAKSCYDSTVVVGDREEFRSPRLVQRTANTSPGRTPEKYLSARDNAPKETENLQLSPKHQICTCAKTNHFRSVSPNSPGKCFRESRNKGDYLADDREFPKYQLTDTGIKQRATGSSLPAGCPVHHVTSPSPAHNERQELEDVAVHHILERINTMESILAQEISAERGILNQCLYDIQKLLSSELTESGEGWSLRNGQQFKERRVLGNHTHCKVQEKRKEVASDSSTDQTIVEQRKSCTALPCHVEDKHFHREVQSPPLNVDRKKRKRKSEPEKDLAQQGKKTVGQVRAKFAETGGKRPSYEPEGALGPSNNQRWPYKDLKAADTGEGQIVRDVQRENLPHPKDVTLTSSSSTGDCTDLSYSSHAATAASVAPRGKHDVTGCGGDMRNVSRFKEIINGCCIDDGTKVSPPGDGKHIMHRQPSPSSPTFGCRPRKYQYSEMVEKKLKKSFEQAQRAMLHLMIERLKMNLRRASAFADFDDSSGGTSHHPQHKPKDPHCKFNTALDQPLVSTELSTNSEMKEPDAFPLTHEQSTEMSQKDTTTQTFDVGILMHRETPQLRPREESCDNSLPPQFQRGPTIAPSADVASPNCLGLRSAQQHMSPQRTPAFSHAQKTTSASQGTQAESPNQNLLVQNCYTLETSPARHVLSTLDTHLSVPLFYPRSSSETAQVKHPAHAKTHSVQSQPDVNAPQFLMRSQIEGTACEPNLFTNSQQPRQALFTLPAQNLGDIIFEKVDYVGFKENTLWDGQGDIVTPQEYIQVGQYVQYVTDNPGTQAQYGYTQPGLSGSTVLSAQCQDRSLQPSQWYGQHHHLCQRQKLQQQQQPQQLQLQPLSQQQPQQQIQSQQLSQHHVQQLQPQLLNSQQLSQQQPHQPFQQQPQQLQPQHHSQQQPQQLQQKQQLSKKLPQHVQPQESCQQQLQHLQQQQQGCPQQPQHLQPQQGCQHQPQYIQQQQGCQQQPQHLQPQQGCQQQPQQLQRQQQLSHEQKSQQQGMSQQQLQQLHLHLRDQNPSQQNVYVEHQLDAQIPSWCQYQVEEPQHHHPQCLQHQEEEQRRKHHNPQFTQVHEANKLGEAVQMSVPQKTTSCPKLGLRNGCPTLELGPVPSGHPPTPLPTWSPSHSGTVWPSVHTAGATVSNPRQAPRSRSRQRSVPQHDGLYLQSQQPPDQSGRPVCVDSALLAKEPETREEEEEAVEEVAEVQRAAVMRKAAFQSSGFRSKAADRTVCITNLPAQLAELDLLNVLSKHGFVSKIYFIKHRTTGQFQGTAYVKFRECREAESAVDALNDLTLEGQKVTAVLISKRPQKPPK